MAEPGRKEYGVDPEEFRSAQVDAAALLDAGLGDVDWSVPPPGVVRFTIDVPSGKLAAMALGKPDDPSVVLVPGATGSKEDFSLMMPDLAEAGYYALTYDLAGQYQSAGAGPENLVPPRQHYDYKLFVDDFLAVLETTATPAHVVAYSFAGIIAQLAYVHRPELFRSITFLGCPPEPGQTFRGVSRIGRFSTWVNGRAGAALLIWGIRSGRVAHVPPGRQRFVNYRFRFTRRASVRDIYTLMQNIPDLRAELAEAPLPKFVAVGEHDLWPLQLHRLFAQAIRARIGVYRGGHSPCETSPHEFSRDLLALYARDGDA
ncbi:alpha/beta fold hydrolase [Pseudarthrobacter niigatensis]|uniref:Pimeloyl-ACP methyl ester carboxylesterase n=1 Tax=Pseudarthrobacter niigatensis TaxID=369935 RepID=A0AAJ1STZ2_9MICC|nr:alpha/beta hydrolase [Pseudarthrobacter niigatensis]MDQ0144228.1 pimeloyl-ACP methyl ester carboxylesterase [Pseudarthrobacter niigatensis]MDQ0266488.1 pimeloyl-ACP methyl ester carboxylesterase [Pseudarthrobacter niigatensis]